MQSQLARSRRAGIVAPTTSAEYLPHPCAAAFQPVATNWKVRPTVLTQVPM